MAVTQLASHPISSPESDITVGRTLPQWALVQERISSAITELLLLLFYVVLVSARFLRSVIGDVEASSTSTPFDLLSPAQEERPTSSPEKTPSPAVSSPPTSSCSTSRSTSPAPPYDQSAVPRFLKFDDVPPFESLSPYTQSLIKSLTKPSPASPASSPQVLSINMLSSVKSSVKQSPAKQSSAEQSFIRSVQESPGLSKLFDTLSIDVTSTEPLTYFQYEVLERLSQRLEEAVQQAFKEASSFQSSSQSSSTSSSSPSKSSSSSSSLSLSSDWLSSATKSSSSVTSISSPSSSSPCSSSSTESSSATSSSPDSSSSSSEKTIYVAPPLRQAYEAMKASARPVPAPIRRPAPVPKSSLPSSPVPKSSPVTSSAPVRPAAPHVKIITVVKGCFYCHNKHPGPVHTHRNKCPWFRHHLSVGTCHLNEYGELCLGPKRLGLVADPLPFWDKNISQGEQVVARTKGTEWDEDPENRCENPIVFGVFGDRIRGDVP
jgi:hypothetical protein